MIAYTFLVCFNEKNVAKLWFFTHLKIHENEAPALPSDNILLDTSSRMANTQIDFLDFSEG